MDIQELEHRGKRYYRRVLIQQGIETDLARKIVKMIKDRKMKVQVSIQGDQGKSFREEEKRFAECDLSSQRIGIRHSSSVQ